MVFVSGQVALDADGNLVGPGDLGAQTAQAMRKLATALARSRHHLRGCRQDHHIRRRLPTRAPQRHLSARSSFFPQGAPPASTLVGVAALAAPEWLIEIEAIALPVVVASSKIASARTRMA